VERLSGPPTAFANALRKLLSGSRVVAVDHLAGERVLEFKFEGQSEIGEHFARSMVVQMTGRSANLFITNDAGTILDRLRDTHGDGQEIGTQYMPPARPGKHTPIVTASPQVAGDSISEGLDRLDLERRAADKFRDAVNAARSRYHQRQKKLTRRKEQLENDIRSHGDAQKWKHFGDVLLANVGTAKRTADDFLATDYFDESLPTLAIPFENDDSITETAEKYFRRYTKARNARDVVAARLAATETEVDQLNRLSLDLERAIQEEDLEAIENFLSPRRETPAYSPRARAGSAESAARSFISSDGFEILVGKKAKDNDVLTFKIAKSLDIWMHAADYPGSHVVVRNPNRKEIPHRTLLEAAELAAFYSQGKAQVKAAVHFTQKKFVNKPKGAAPGLVSLASFKTLLVEPKVPDALAE
jgi:predicted ribosome quality control (RQC) complex YloA/Tae2 family protein